MWWICVEIIVIGSMTALAAAIPGTFLLLRGVALMSDAISHAILLGIVILFLFVHRLESLLLIVGATGAGVLTVICTELLIKTGRLKKDTAIGLVFPLFFSLGVILINCCARSVHLDTDMVLLGEIAFAPFNRLIIGSYDFGPYAFWSIGCVLLLNCISLILFYKELQLVIFDPVYAYVIGLFPLLMYYGLMTITSITAVVSFNVVGSIVIVALMITPPATAYLLTTRLPLLIGFSCLIGVSSVMFGYGMAYLSDVSIAGSIATMTGIFFMVVLIGAPQKGIISTITHKRRVREELSSALVCTVLYTRMKNTRYTRMPIHILCTQFGWNTAFFHTTITRLCKHGFIIIDHEDLMLTKEGKVYACTVLKDI